MRNKVFMNSTELPQKKLFSIGIAIVVFEDRVLVGKRDELAHLGGMDEFPGGKSEKGESAAACAIRECKEETGLQVDIIERLHHEVFDYKERSVELNFFLCHPADGEETSVVNKPFRWVELHKLDVLNFPDGNNRVVQILQDRFS